MLRFLSRWQLLSRSGPESPQHLSQNFRPTYSDAPLTIRCDPRTYFIALQKIDVVESVKSHVDNAGRFGILSQVRSI